MTIRLEMLRVFRVVAEKGTLAGAAHVLGRTPSAISMMLAQLENDIGAPLFETDRKSRLSPLGQLVLDESRRATDVFDKSTEAIRRHVISTAGIVRIAAVPSATVSILPVVILAFQAKYPDVRIEISDVDSGVVRRRIQRDEADIGILSARPGDTSDGEIVQCDDLGIVCSENGPVYKAHLNTSEGGRWSLLNYEPLITNPLCLLVDHPSVHSAMSISTLEARNTTAILSFVRSGLGVSILPFDAVRSQPEEVEFFVPEYPFSQRELRKIRRPGTLANRAAENFWDMLIQI